MGISFKENCPVIRNSKSIEIVNELEGYNLDVDIYDPVVFTNSPLITDNSKFIKELKNNQYAGMIITVAHNQFKSFDINY